MDTWNSSNNMEVVSKRLYEYLSDKVVGSEKVVEYRRMFFRILDEIVNRCKMIKGEDLQVSSGSKAEGMDLPGSDYDIMRVCTHGLVIVHDSVAGDLKSCVDHVTCCFYMNTEYAQPGFTLIQSLLSNDPDISVKTEFGTFLSSKLWREKFEKSFENKKMKFNGPCVTNAMETVDHVHCLRTNTWPQVAKQWITRPRPFENPSPSLISEISGNGVLLVPIGSKSTPESDNSLEWRISFSIPEKCLIHSWNHTQFLCYALLKLFLKDFIKRNKNINKLMCSYFLKTAIFWLIEENSLDIWRPEKLIYCFMLCLKRLIFWNQYGYIPNYFIPEHNMIDRIFPGQSRSELVFIMNSLYQSGWTCIFNFESLAEFECYRPAANIHNINSHAFDVAVIPLIPLLIKGCFAGCPREKFPTEICLDHIYSYVKNTHQSTKLRKIYLLFFLHFSALCAKQKFYRVLGKDNKSVYSEYKEWLSQVMIGTYLDPVSCWLHAALYFYMSRQYYKSLVILEHILTLLWTKPCYLWEESEITFGEVNMVFQKIGPKINRFWSYLRLTVMQSFFMCCELNGPLYNFDEECSLENVNVDDFVYLFPNFRKIIEFSPAVFTYYLCFLCHHQLQDFPSRNEMLEKLVWIVENEFTIENLWHKSLASGYVWRAYQIVGSIFHEVLWSKRFTTK